MSDYEEGSIMILGDDEMFLIFGFLFFSGSITDRDKLKDWFNVQLVCKDWQRISRIALDPRKWDQLPVRLAVVNDSDESIK